MLKKKKKKLLFLLWLQRKADKLPQVMSFRSASMQAEGYKFLKSLLELERSEFTKPPCLRQAAQGSPESETELVRS